MPLNIQEANIKSSIDDKTSLGENICYAMNKEINKIADSEEYKFNICFEDLSFSIVRDSYAQKNSLEGFWVGPQNNRTGSIVFHGDGTFYAEHDVVKSHPTKKKWFIEAVTAWGKGENIKTELRLLPYPE